MIISHRHQFLFFAVPKTGTHAVREALREHMGDEDLEQAGLFVKKRQQIRLLRQQFAEVGFVVGGVFAGSGTKDHLSEPQIKRIERIERMERIGW